MSSAEIRGLAGSLSGVTFYLPFSPSLCLASGQTTNNNATQGNAYIVGYVAWSALCFCLEEGPHCSVPRGIPLPTPVSFVSSSADLSIGTRYSEHFVPITLLRSYPGSSVRSTQGVHRQGTQGLPQSSKAEPSFSGLSETCHPVCHLPHLRVGIQIRRLTQPRKEARAPFLWCVEHRGLPPSL